MSNSDADTETRAERRERYERVVRTVGHNCDADPDTGPPGARRSQVVVSLAAHGPYAADGVTRSLRAAVEQTDLLRWDDHRGVTRYTPTDEEDRLLAVCHYLVAYGVPNRAETIATINHLRSTDS